MKRLMYFLLVFVFITYLSLIVSAMLPLIGENKTHLTAAFFQENLLYIVKHPIETVKQLIITKNPLFIGLECFALIYSSVISIKWGSKKKQGWEVDPHQQSHGSARLAKPSEIFTHNEFIPGTKKQALEELKASLMGTEEQQ